MDGTLPRRDDGEQLQHPFGEQRNSSLRRLACDACRARKVRCDRRDPPCSRCAKVGIRCRYSSRLKPPASKMDLSQFLLTLDTRLKQAEVQLASNTVSRTPEPFPMVWEHVELQPPSSSSSSLPSSLVPTPPIGTAAGAAAQLATGYPFADDRYGAFDHMGPILTGDDIPTSELLYDAFASMLSTDAPLEQAVPYMDQSLDVDLDVAFFDDFSSALPTAPLHVTVPPGLGQELYDRYFDLFHPIIPIIDKTRFQAEVAQPSLPIEVRLLSYAMGALSALSSDSEQRAYAEKLYEHARYYLDVCERQESGESLSNIHVVQACALLTLYEFKRPSFARAWITLARAIRLAKIMGLDKPDGSASIFTNWGMRERPAPPPSSPAEMEERRRTVWVLYIFDAFASLTTKVSDFQQPILIALPSPAPYPDNASKSDQMPSLQNVFESAEMAELSSFSGTVIMTSLYQACFEHAEAASRSKSYDFWDTHYRIDKAINRCRATLISQQSNPDSDSPLSLGLRMNLGAVAIMLHEAMLTKVQSDDLPASLTSEASSKCISAVADIVEPIQTALRLTDKKLEAFQQVDRFLIWPVTAAIQVCFRMLYHSHSQEDAKPYIEFLRILTNLIKDYIDPDQIDPALLHKVNDRVAELERGARKS